MPSADASASGPGSRYSQDLCGSNLQSDLNLRVFDAAPDPEQASQEQARRVPRPPFANFKQPLSLRSSSQPGSG